MVLSGPFDFSPRIFLIQVQKFYCSKLIVDLVLLKIYLSVGWAPIIKFKKIQAYEIVTLNDANIRHRDINVPAEMILFPLEIRKRGPRHAVSCQKIVF